MQALSTTIFIIYLIRSYLHIAYRSSWYISLLLLCLFLTSTYEITYLDFISTPASTSFDFNGISNIILSWFSGSSASLLMSGLLFIIVKSNLHKLSNTLIIELLFISLSSSFILIKSLEPIFFLPIIISIWAALFLNIFKDKSTLNLKDLFLNKFYIKVNSIKDINLLFPIFFLIISIFSTPEIGDIGMISYPHIIRIIFFFFILFISVLPDQFLFRKIFFTQLPIFFIYLGIITSSIISHNFRFSSNSNLLSLEALTSIALFPIFEVVISKYYQIGSFHRIFNIFKIPNKLFKFAVKSTMLLIAISYVIFLISQ